MPYYIRYQGRKQGPLSEAQLVTLLSRGTVTKETEASPDENDWMPLGDFPEFDRLYSKIVEKQLRQPAPIAEPTSGTYGLQAPAPPKDDPFAKAGFPPADFGRKPDTIVKRTVETAPLRPEPTGAPEKDARLLYAVLGAAGGLLMFLVVVVAFFSFSGDRTGPEVTEIASRPEMPEEPEPVEPEPIVTPEPIVMPEPVETPEPVVIPKPAETPKPETPEPEDKPEPTEPPPVELKEEPKPEPMSAGESDELKRAVARSGDRFPVRLMAANAFGGVAATTSVQESFAPLYPMRDRFVLNYVSFVPGRVFSAERRADGDVTVSHGGSEILRLTLTEDGLKAEWLDSPAVSTNSFRTINGAVFAELEVLRSDTKELLGSVSLFPPVQKPERFSMSTRQVLLSDLEIDLDALEIGEKSLGIVGIKNLFKSGKRETISDDTIRYFFHDAGKEYHVDIRAIAQTPARSKDGTWRIPIHPEAEFLPSKEDVAMLDRIRVFAGLNVNKTNLKTAIGDGADARVTLQVLNDFDRAFQSRKSSLSRRNAAAYRKYCEVVQNYRERLDKAKRITMTESIGFEIVLVHPEDGKKTISLAEVGGHE